MKSSASSSPLVWMNVTTSANWDRPAVGIVRVEQALCAALSRIYGDRFRRCVWIDDMFVEWTDSHANHVEVVEAADILLPRSSSFDLARRILSGRLAQFTVEATKAISGDNPTELTARIPLDAGQHTRPREGDILISVGLDWDQPYHTEFYRLSKYCGLKIITCCYDLIPILFPQYCVGDVASRFKGYFDLVNWSSSAVLCISKQSENDLINLWQELGAHPRLTKVIPLGDNVPSGKGSISPHVKALTEAPFILFVSTIERRKNHEVLYKAYHLLCREGRKNTLPKLVFVGMPGWGVGDLLKDIELDPLTRGLIVQLNHVNDAELLELYKKSLFCVYPSLYEGWGLPVGEALSLGKVVLSSDQGSLPEVGGDLVRYVEAWNPRAWADAILDLITKREDLSKLAAKVRDNYKPRTWSNTGKVVAEVIDQLAKQPTPQRNFLAGYDFSTQCGLHAGPCIRATGQPGVLMHGPYIGLRPGRYVIEINLNQVKTQNSKAVFDVVSHDARNQHARLEWCAGDCQTSNNKETEMVRIDIKLDRYVHDLEVRCFIEGHNFFEIGGVNIFNQ